MQPVIDMRVTVPYESFKNLPHFEFYQSEASKRSRKNLRVGDSLSAIEKSVDILVQELRKAGVEKACTFLRVTENNIHKEDILGLLNSYPDLFIGIPHIEVSDAVEAIAEIKEYVQNGPCRAIYIEPGFRKSHIVMHGNDPRIFPVYELCEQEHIPILLQYGGAVNPLEFFTPQDIDDIMLRFPKLKLAITHGGWPQVMAFCQLAYKHEGLYLIPDAYFNKYPGSSEYVQAANYILQDKIMFASLYPGVPVEEAIDNYKKSGLFEDVLPKIFYDNAARFLGLVDDDKYIFANGHNYENR